MENVNSKMSISIDNRSNLYICFVLFIIGLAVYKIHDSLKQDFFIYSSVEESYMKVKYIKVRYPLSKHKNKTVDGRLTGRARDYYAIGYDLKDSTEVIIELPPIKYLSEEKIIYDAKYDTIFPFLHKKEIIKDKKSRKGLFITSYVAKLDSILPVWRPKDTKKSSSVKWEFRRKSDDKENWYEKWKQQFIFFIIFLFAAYFIEKKFKK